MDFTPENTKALGFIPCGLSVVSACDQDSIEGFLGSWIQQVSFDPLLISICVKTERQGYDILQKTGLFCLNIVGSKSKNIIKHFWNGYIAQNNPFKILDTQKTKHGNVILKEALAYIECKKIDQYSPGDHEIIIGQVLDSGVLKKDDNPLMHIRKNGLSY